MALIFLSCNPSASSGPKKNPFLSGFHLRSSQKEFCPSSVSSLLTILTYLLGLTNLKELHLSFNKVTDAGVAHLEGTY